VPERELVFAMNRLARRVGEFGFGQPAQVAQPASSLRWNATTSSMA